MHPLNNYYICRLKELNFKVCLEHTLAENYASTTQER